jgi:hypothetical protein
VSEPASPAGRSLRSPFDVDLPVAWACRHGRAVVGFSHAGRSLGWHAYLVGDDGRVLLSFPWYDHVDVALGGVSRWSFAPWRLLFADGPPTEVGEEGWDDLEQGWWGFVIPDGGDVYVGETDLDAITETEPPLRIACEQPGHVLVNDVLVTWNCLARNAYTEAWREAIRSCRRGRPRPVGERRDTVFEFRTR